MDYLTLNRIVAFSLFAVTMIVYVVTLAPTVVFWDVGEFIAAAWMMQVPHPPGSPLFLIVTRIATMSFNSLIAQSERPSGASQTGASAPFSEAIAWRDVGAGWQKVFGSFRGVGYSIEWHDFVAKREFDWSPSFHPDCVELCLNLSGKGFVEGRGSRAEFAPNTAGFYYRQKEPLTAKRAAGERHQFLTVEFSCPFQALQQCVYQD